MDKAKPLYYYPNDYISVSALQGFESCPISFYLKYYGGVVFPQKESMELGSRFQDALNAKYGGQDYAEIINGIEKKHRDTAKILIDRAHDFDKIVSLDKEYTADFGIGIPVMFIPDVLIDNGDRMLVIENKYSSGYYNEKMVQKHVQGTVYYYGVGRLFDKPVDVKYQIFNHKDVTVKLVDVEKTGWDAADMLGWMSTTLKNIQECYDSGSWIINQHGKYDCGLGKACPIKFPNKA